MPEQEISNTFHKTILVITGTGNPARAAANIYAKFLYEENYDVHFIENRIGLKHVGSFFWRRFKRYGLVDCLSVLWLRLGVTKKARVEKKYEVDFSVSDLDEIKSTYLEQVAPHIIVTNACALLSADLIDRLRATGAQVINVHNGINPRYRGTGNFWAIFERNFNMTGVTLHHLDHGIDTGKIIAQKKIDFISGQVPFTHIDIVAFETGAHMALEYILKGKVSATCNCTAVRSRFYTFPTRQQHDRAIARYNSALQSVLPQQTAKSWLNSFRNYARQADLDVYQRQHWGDSSSVVPRDHLVRNIVNDVCIGEAILDVGCGDGRYRDYWPDIAYWGCDFSLQTMKLGGRLVSSSSGDEQNLALPNTKIYSDGHSNHFIESSAESMPLKDACFPTILGVGLMQHIDNTGAVADEILRVLAPGGMLVINTLRQPSWLELLPAQLFGVFKSDFALLVSAIKRQDYFRNLEIGQTKLARRYTLAELKLLFAPHARIKIVRYNGIFRTRLLSREITIVFQRKVEANQ